MAALRSHAVVHCNITPAHVHLDLDRGILKLTSFAFAVRCMGGSDGSASSVPSSVPPSMVSIYTAPGTGQGQHVRVSV